MITDDRVEVHLNHLETWLRYPSVSADSQYHAEVVACAEYTADRLREVGLDVTVYPTLGFPVVYAEWCHAPGQPTILIYGHYDVQPADPLELWETPPFEPSRRDGQLYARGVSDDKGQIYCHIAAVEELLKNTGRLPLNVKFIIEGEEEIGSPSLAGFVTEKKDLLAADVALVSDTPMIAENRPSLCTSLRGLVYLELKVRVLSGDLHSGQHGGTVPNAIHALMDILSKMKDADGHIQIPGIYDDVLPISPDTHANVRRLPFDEAAYCEAIGADHLVGEPGFHPFERRWYRPTFDVNGIWGGYIGEGSKTVIPAEAFCKLSMRLVSNQDPHKVTAQFNAYLKSITPRGVAVEVIEHSGGFPARVSSDHPAVSAALGGLKQAFGVDPVFQGEGGTVPIVADFNRILGLDTILMGLNLQDDGIHAPNERMSLANIRRGIDASIGFLELYSKETVNK
jgi:acetylornithine deacetylase/succinyl-diaminopimelate desuccinylase-like protein